MRELLPLFAKPSRYLGSEWGVVLKDPATVSVRLALAFPDLYEVGMSYLGQKILYAAVNARPQYWAERAYAPGRDVIALLRQRGLPLCTLESDTPLGRLDAVSFHLTHELCYTNVLLMLDLAGIPLRACERDERHPLVIAGGGAAFNAEPLAPFFDLMQLGEGEESLPRLLDLLAGHKARGASRREFLLAAAALPGVYVPAFFEDVRPGRTPRPLIPGYERVAKAVVPDLNRAVIPTRQIVPFGGVVHDRLILEIARGCTRGCRFCHAGMVYRPVRERKPEDLARFIEEGLAATGFEELSFLSLSTGDYSALEALFDASFSRCAAEQVAISLPSLRVGSVSERLYGLMSRIRRTGVTIAPEAGSQRLRDVINKGVTEEGLLSHVAMLFAKGWSQVKLYFMIGLPTETDEDLVAIFELCKKVLAQAPRGLRRLQVSAALAIFIPKPHTPFQWEEQVSLDEARRRIDLLRDLFRTDTRLTLRWHEPRMSYLEGVFSRAGRELSGVVERAYVKGALFTAWEDQLDLDKWLEALAEEGLDAQHYLAARDPEAELPWDHLDPGVDKRFLLAERARAYAGKISADCRFEACRACGVCAVGDRPSRLPEAADLKPQVVFARRDQEAQRPGEQEEPGEGGGGGAGSGSSVRPPAAARDARGPGGQGRALSPVVYEDRPGRLPLDPRGPERLRARAAQSRGQAGLLQGFSSQTPLFLRPGPARGRLEPGRMGQPLHPGSVCPRGGARAPGAAAARGPGPDPGRGADRRQAPGPGRARGLRPDPYGRGGGSRGLSGRLAPLRRNRVLALHPDQPKGRADPGRPALFRRHRGAGAGPRALLPGLEPGLP